jgi:plastocyanin
MSERVHKLHEKLEGPGVPWLLILIVMMLMGLSVTFLSGKDVNLENNGAVLSPIPTADIYVPRIYTVSYKNGVFSPTNLRIHVGDTVRFKNDGVFAMRVVSDPHPQHNDLLGFDSIGDIPQNSYFAFTFSNKGTFGYHNEKKSQESGTIIIR